jgi:hypothetical protein
MEAVLAVKTLEGEEWFDLGIFVGNLALNRKSPGKVLHKLHFPYTARHIFCMLRSKDYLKLVYFELLTIKVGFSTILSQYWTYPK